MAKKSTPTKAPAPLSESPSPAGEVSSARPRAMLLRRAALTGVTIIGALFLVRVVATAVVIVRPEWFQKANATDLEDTADIGAISWFLSRLSMVPAGPSPKTVIAVMIENSYAARPNQAGLDKAITVLEMQVEGGISRFSALFDKNDLPERAGPVRSLRPYFLQGIEHWSSLLLFAGGSPEALEQAPQASIPAINGLGRPQNFKRDNELYAPHNLFIDAENMRLIAEESELKQVAWPPYIVGSAPDGETASVVTLNFLSESHDVTYTAKSGVYERENGGIISPATPANIVVIETPILSIGEYGRLEIPMVKGKMLLFRSGYAYKGTWSLGENGLQFIAEDGTALRLARGMTWMTGLPTLDRVSWE